MSASPKPYFIAQQARWLTCRHFIQFPDDDGNRAFLRIRKVCHIGRTGAIQFETDDSLPAVTVGSHDLVDYQEAGNL